MSKKSSYRWIYILLLTGLLTGASALGLAAPGAAEPPSVASDRAEASDTGATGTEADAAAGAAAEATAEAAPVDTVESFHAGLLAIMKQAETLGFQGRVDELRPLMSRTFDLDFMASKTVGSHWRKLSEADKERWKALFTRLTMVNYAGRFTGFTGEEFVTLGVEDAARGTRMVLTRIVVPDGKDVELNYRLLRTNDGWRVIDVYLDGTVSELALRRSEYSSALKRQGFEELVAAVETKIQDLKEKGQADG